MQAAQTNIQVQQITFTTYIAKGKHVGTVESERDTEKGIKRARERDRVLIGSTAGSGGA
jgi:hypothetical protein